MRILRVMLPALAAIGLWIGFSVQPVEAAALPVPPAQTSVDEAVAGSPQAYGIHCADGLCTVEISLGDKVPVMAKVGAPILVKVLQDNLTFLPEGAGIEVTDRLVLSLPLGDLEIVDADMVLELGPQREVQRLRGTARIPLPALGLMDEMAISSPAVADVGLDTGANLAHLGAPLVPERRYLFFDIGTGLALDLQMADPSGEAHRLSLEVPPGQHATLVVDPGRPLFYVVGNVNLADDDQIAFVGNLLGLGLDGQTVGEILPIRQRTGLQVRGLLTDDWDEAYLTLQGAYTVDGGLVGRWIGLELTPLIAEGALTLEQEGMLLAGNLRSEIQPDRIFDGGLAAQLYVPFKGGWQEAYVQVGGDAAVPLAGLHADGLVRMDSSLEMLVNGSYAVPFVQGSVDRVLAIKLPQIGPAMNGLAGGAVAGAAGGYDAAQDVWEATAGAFCGWTSLCDGNGSDDLGPVAAAQ